jgi:hypothetical protein
MTGDGYGCDDDENGSSEEFHYGLSFSQSAQNEYWQYASLKFIDDSIGVRCLALSICSD